MCTMITHQAKIEGRGKSGQDWFEVRQANVSYDHPYDLPLEHALNIDFVNEAQGPGARTLCFVDEIDIERMLEGQVIRMIVRHIRLAHFKPILAAFAAAFDLCLMSNHRAHAFVLLALAISDFV